jgi:hypothetical protein
MPVAPASQFRTGQVARNSGGFSLPTQSDPLVRADRLGRGPPDAYLTPAGNRRAEEEGNTLRAAHSGAAWPRSWLRHPEYSEAESINREDQKIGVPELLERSRLSGGEAGG